MAKWTRWSEVERDTIQRAVSLGLTQGAIYKAGLLPGRNLNAVQNMMRHARCLQRQECNHCGKSSPDILCRACKERKSKSSLDRRERLKTTGRCVLCAKNQADASLTRCQTCADRRNPDRRNPPKGPGTGGYSQTILRWNSSPGLTAVPRFIPPKYNGHLILDLFGGAAGLTQILVEAGSPGVVYNDIHPGLCNFMRVIQSTDAAVFYEACRWASLASREQILSMYETLTDPTTRAAVFWAVAQNVQYRNMRDKVLPENLHGPDVRGPNARRTFIKKTRRMQRAFQGVEIHNLDAIVLLRRYTGRKRVFVVCDPPYPGWHGFEYGFEGRHGELMDALRASGLPYLVTLNSRRESMEACLGSRLHTWRLRAGRTHTKALIASSFPILDLESVDPSEYGYSTPPQGQLPGRHTARQGG